MAEWWQSPAYLERKAAGEVVTPGLVDWGGMGKDIYDFLQAPYLERQARESQDMGEDPTSSVTLLRSSVVPYRGTPFPTAINGSGTADGYTATLRRAPSLPNPTPSSGTVYYPQTPGTQYGYNTATGNYEVKRAGQSYTSVPGPKMPPGKAAPSVANPAPQMPFGLQPFTGTGPTPAGYRPGMRFASTPRAADDGVIDLNLDGLSDRGAQGMADSQGQPVRNKGKTYYPGGKAPAVSGSLSARDTRGPLGQALGLKTSGLGGLLSGLFGGGNRASPSAAGLVPHLGAVPTPSAPAPTYTTTPFQEDRFQTTTGAQMPASMNNSRWTTGY